MNKKIRTDITNHFKKDIDDGAFSLVNLDTGSSPMEAVGKALNHRFAAKVILVNHDSSLRGSVDTACSNLAIKYNCLYLSAYQVIKKHIDEGTEWGQRLVANKQEKCVSEAVTAGKD